MCVRARMNKRCVKEELSLQVEHGLRTAGKEGDTERRDRTATNGDLFLFSAEMGDQETKWVEGKNKGRLISESF